MAVARSEVCWFSAGVISAIGAAAVLIPMTSETASAVACPPPVDYGQTGAQEAPNDSTSDDIRGTRANVKAATGPTNCQRISSITNFSPSFNGAFEMGMVIGYSHVSGSTYAHPHIFNFAIEASTGDVAIKKVWTSPLPTEGTFETLQVSDTNANTYWGCYFNGAQLQPNGVNMDFARGWSVVSMERGWSSDSGYGRWEEIREYHDGNGWTYWDNATAITAGDTDPGYDMVVVNAHETVSQQ